LNRRAQKKAVFIVPVAVKSDKNIDDEKY